MNSPLSKLIEQFEDMLSTGAKHYMDVDDIMKLAVGYEKKDYFSRALQVIDFGLSIHPNDTDLHIQRAKFLLFEDRLEECEALLPHLPQNHILVMLVTIEYYFIVDKDLLAHEVIGRILRLTDFDEKTALNVINILWGYSNRVEITNFILRSIDVLPEESALLSIELAIIYRDDKKEQMAIDVLNKVIDKDPYQLQPWIELGTTYNMMKEYEKALEAFEYAIAIDDSEHDLIISKVEALNALGRQEEATEFMNNFANYIEDKTTLYSEYAQKLLKSERTYDAILMFRKAAEYDPKNSEILFQLAYSYCDIGNIPQAIEYALAATQIRPSCIDYRIFLGNLFALKLEFEKAIEIFEVCLEDQPNNTTLLLSIGDNYEKLNEIEESIVYYERAFAVKPHDIKICFRLLLTYYTTKRMNEAIELTKKICLLMEKVDSNDEKISNKEKEEIRAASQAFECLRTILREMIINEGIEIPELFGKITKEETIED